MWALYRKCCSTPEVMWAWLNSKINKKWKNNSKNVISFRVRHWKNVYWLAKFQYYLSWLIVCGLPWAHDVAICICLALRPQQHPCPSAPAGDRNPLAAATPLSCAGLAVSSPLALMFGSDVSVMCVWMDMMLPRCVYKSIFGLFFFGVLLLEMSLRGERVKIW